MRTSVLRVKGLQQQQVNNAVGISLETLGDFVLCTRYSGEVTIQVRKRLIWSAFFEFFWYSLCGWSDISSILTGDILIWRLGPRLTTREGTTRWRWWSASVAARRGLGAKRHRHCCAVRFGSESSEPLPPHPPHPPQLDQPLQRPVSPIFNTLPEIYSSTRLFS